MNEQWSMNKTQTNCYFVSKWVWYSISVSNVVIMITFQAYIIIWNMKQRALKVMKSKPMLQGL